MKKVSIEKDIGWRTEGSQKTGAQVCNDGNPPSNLKWKNKIKKNYLI